MAGVMDSVPLPAWAGDALSPAAATLAASPGVTSPGVTSPGVTSPGVTSPGATSPGAAPVGVINDFYAALLGVMRKGGQLGGEGRYHKLEPVIDRTFNLRLMTEVAVGARWSHLTAEEQGKLVGAFRRFTIASYANHFDSYGGERFDVRPDVQSVAGTTMVMSQLVPRGKGPIALNYVMRETNGVWQAIDVYAEGTISELARRRSEFGAVLSRNGADGLADRLVERAQTLIDEPA
ncbi:MAG: ABC transporter substrate-binding protein [Pseudomonadota bacterium]